LQAKPHSLSLHRHLPAQLSLQHPSKSQCPSFFRHLHLHHLLRRRPHPQSRLRRPQRLSLHLRHHPSSQTQHWLQHPPQPSRPRSLCLIPLLPPQQKSKRPQQPSANKVRSQLSSRLNSLHLHLHPPVAQAMEMMATEEDEAAMEEMEMVEVGME